MKLFAALIFGVSSFAITDNVLISDLMSQMKHKTDRLNVIYQSEVEEMAQLAQPVVEAYMASSMKILHERQAESTLYVDEQKDSPRYGELQTKKERVSNLIADVREQCYSGGVTNLKEGIKQLPILRECVRRLKEQYGLKTKVL